MTTIHMPAMAVSRKMADKVVQEANLDGETQVRIDGRNLDVNSDSFVAQLVKLVSEAGVKQIEIVGGGADWLREISAEATNSGLSFVKI